MYVFCDDHLVLANHLMCEQSLGKIISPSFSIPQLPVGFCGGLRPHRLSSVHFGISIVLLIQQMARQSRFIHRISSLLCNILSKYMYVHCINIYKHVIYSQVLYGCVYNTYRNTYIYECARIHEYYIKYPHKAF